MTSLATSEPQVLRLPAGEVSVSFDDGLTWVRFKSAAAYNDVREQLDREQMQHECAAWQSYVTERDAYHGRVQALRAERDDLAAGF